MPKKSFQLALCLSLIACTSFAQAECPRGAEAWQQTQMFFGRGIGSGGEVTDAGWADFVTTEIIPRFEAGFTVVDGAGFWQGCKAAANGACERSKLLLVQYASKDTAANDKLAAIAGAYVTRFHQQAVMRSDSAVCTQFYGAN